MQVEEVVVDEGVNGTVQNRVHIAGLRIGAMVLDQSVWLEGIRPDLGTEGDGPFGHVLCLTFVRSFLQLQFVKSGLQNLEGRFLVFVLGFFVLTLGDQPGWYVRDAYRRVRGVDGLSAGTAGAENINTDIFVPEIYFNILTSIGIDVD